MKLKDLAAATPESRDPYIDFLRAISILAVVLGHWMIASVSREGSRVVAVNVLHVIPGLWVATWILQVMPLFFFVGGFSNHTSLLRRWSYGEFVAARTMRLVRPAVVFLLIWIPLAAIADHFFPVLRIATTAITRPLWFIGIYLILIVLAPLMVKLHHWFGWRALAFMVVAASLVDVAAIGLGFDAVGYLNFAFVWLAVHQLGFFYSDTSLLKSRYLHVALLVIGLSILIALTTSGMYSSAMVGIRGERSNTNPPTVAILALASMQVGLAMLVRARATRWLSRPRAWMATIAVNARIMTIFLWHQTALVIGAGVFLILGIEQPLVGSSGWWAMRPAWVALMTIILLLIVPVVGRFERVAPATYTLKAATAALAGALVLAGILGFAAEGLDEFVVNLRNAFGVAAGLAILTLRSEALQQRI